MRSSCSARAVRAVLLAATALVVPSAGARGVAPPVAHALYVNMINSSTGHGYEIGRFVRGTAAPPGPVARPTGCHLWSPSVVRVRGLYRLYAAEHDCLGWHRVVLFTSRDGIRFRRRGTVLQTRDELRKPIVVWDGQRFHLWYGLDRGGLSLALAYADSRDGLHFAQRGVKFRARGFGALSPSFAFVDDGRWFLLATAFSTDLRSAAPHLLTFENPRARAYADAGPLLVDQSVPKLDPSYVCRSDGRLWSLFTSFGEKGKRFGWEWTAVYRASKLAGRWRPVGDPQQPALDLASDGPKTSVENPAPARTGAELPRC